MTNPNLCLLAMLTKFTINDMGDIETARKVFDVLPQRGIDAWNAMIIAYSQKAPSWSFTSILLDDLGWCYLDLIAWLLRLPPRHAWAWQIWKQGRKFSVEWGIVGLSLMCLLGLLFWIYMQSVGRWMKQPWCFIGCQERILFVGQLW